MVPRQIVDKLPHMSTRLLTLPEAASLLKKSERQIRYLIQQGKLPAIKKGSRWWVPFDAIQNRPEKIQQNAAKLEHLEAVVRDTLHLEKTGTPAWSIRKMRAVDSACRIYKALAESCGPESPPTLAAVESLRHLVRGGHAFRKTDKARSYHDARSAACDALAWSLLRPRGEAHAAAHLIEAELLPALAGLLRHTERKT